MATRFALLCLVLAGCQSAGRTPTSMVPAATLDERPRPTAAAAPRGVAGAMLSTAAGDKSKNGEEESAYEFQLPTPPKETVDAPSKIELPPAPVIPITVTPPTLPPVTPSAIEAPPKIPFPNRRTPDPTPTTPDLPTFTPPPMPAATSPAFTPPALPSFTPPSVEPMAPVQAPPATTTSPTLAPPIPVEAKPPEPKKVEAKPVSNASPSPAPAPLGAGVSIIETSPSSGDTLGSLRSIFERAHQRTAQMDSYTMRMRRREVVGGAVRPEEIILAKFRKEPFSIYLKWVGEEGKNREVCYVNGMYNSKIHILMGPGENFLFANKHLEFAPDHPLVKSNCRYPIIEAGIGPLVARFGRLVTALEKGDSREGSARYLGKVKRPEFEEPVEGVAQTLPAKYEGLFPGGGQRMWYFDTTSGLPVLITTFDEKGRELEYYCHDRFQFSQNLDADDFNPNKMWKTPVK